MKTFIITLVLAVTITQATIYTYRCVDFKNFNPAPPGQVIVTPGTHNGDHTVYTQKATYENGILGIWVDCCKTIQPGSWLVGPGASVDWSLGKAECTHISPSLTAPAASGTMIGESN